MLHLTREATCFIQCDDRPYERQQIHDYVDEEDEIYEQMTQVAGTGVQHAYYRRAA